jgi:hypothetical protein
MEQPGRPGSVVAAGLIVIAVAALTFAPAVLGAPAYLVVSPVPDEVQPLRWLLAHYLEVAGGQALFALAMFVCGVGLLRRASWARRASQILMLTWATLILGFGVWMMSWFPRAGAFSIVWGCMALANALSFAVPAGLAVWLLQTRDASAWFKDAR